MKSSEGAVASEHSSRDAFARRHGAIERIVWGVILGAPLLVLAFMAVSALTRHAPPVRTGDALLDAFLQQLVDHDELTDPALYSFSDPVAAVVHGEAIFAPLEPQYANDPRFWMLRYDFGWMRSGEAYYSKTAKCELESRYKWLEEAKERGIADAAVLDELYRGYEQAWADATRATLGPPSAIKVPSRAAFLAYLNSVHAEVERLHAGDERRFLAELSAAAPDDALPHYRAAYLAHRCGDNGAASTELRAGNAAARCDLMWVYPAGLLLERARQDSLVGDEILTGFLAEFADSCVYTNSGLEGMAGDLSAIAAQHADLHTLQAIHTLCCRLGTAEHVNYSYADDCKSIELAIEKTAESGWPQPHSPAQVKALGELSAKLIHLSAALGAVRAIIVSRTPAASPNQPRTLRSMLGMLPGALSGGRRDRVLELQGECRDFVAQQTRIAKHVVPLFKELERFDYTTLSWQ
jgi:hypothetical protein